MAWAQPGCQRRACRPVLRRSAGSGGGGGGGGDSPTAAQPRAPGAAPVAALAPDPWLPAAFGTLAAVSAAFGVAALAAPGGLVAAVTGAAATDLELAFTRIAGGTMAISAAAELSLSDAASNGRLGSATYQRLLWAILVKNGLYLLAFALASDTWSPALAALYPSAPLVSLVAAGRALAATRGSGGGGGAFAALLAPPQSAAGWVYSAFALLYAATLAACFAPEALFTAPPSPLSALLKHTWAPGFWLAGAACAVLKDAADRGRLGAGTFRRLNLGLAATEAVYSAAYGSAIAGGLAAGGAPAASNLAGSLGIAAYCLYQYASAKSKE